MKKELPLVSMEKLLKRAGAARVSETAKQELQSLLKEKIQKTTQKAQTFTKHSNRKTIKKEDISISIEN